MDRHSKIYVAGHTGVIGSSVYRNLLSGGFDNIVVKSHSDMDLMNYDDVMHFFESERPEYVFYCAGRDGDAEFIKKHGAEIFRHHSVMQTNVIHASYCCGVKRLLYTGSGACYGTDEESPFREENAIKNIQTGMIQPYAAAKIAGVVMCNAYHEEYGCDFFSALPCHLFSYDNMKKDNSNILEDIIKRISVAKKEHSLRCHLNIWGKGEAKTKYIFQDECADAFIFVMNSGSEEKVVNICTEEALSLSEIASMAKEMIGYSGELEFDSEKKERNVDRCMSGEKLREMGWIPQYTVSDRISELCNYYMNVLQEKSGGAAW